MTNTAVQLCLSVVQSDPKCMYFIWRRILNYWGRGRCSEKG